MNATGAGRHDNRIVVDLSGKARDEIVGRKGASQGVVRK